MESNDSYPVPIVRLIISEKTGRVLILKRAETSYGLGAWCLPGGKVDYGDTVEKAAARELYEETSLVSNSMRFLFYQDSLPPEPGGMHCINLYLECAIEGTLSLNRESSEFAWVGPRDLADYEIAFRNDEALMRYWNEKGRVD